MGRPSCAERFVAAQLQTFFANLPPCLVGMEASNDAGLHPSPNASRILIEAGLGPAILAVEALHSVQLGYVVNQ